MLSRLSFSSQCGFCSPFGGHPPSPSLSNCFRRTADSSPSSLPAKSSIKSIFPVHPSPASAPFASQAGKSVAAQGVLGLAPLLLSDPYLLPPPPSSQSEFPKHPKYVPNTDRQLPHRSTASTFSSRLHLFVLIVRLTSAPDSSSTITVRHLRLVAPSSSTASPKPAEQAQAPVSRAPRAP